MKPNHWIFLGALIAGLAVAAGAFGAHGLEERLNAKQLADFKTAAQYQWYHGVALVLVGLASRGRRFSGQLAGWSFLAGTILFSGCLYGWIFTGSRVLVMLVPLGGLAFIVGWAALAVQTLWWDEGGV